MLLKSFGCSFIFGNELHDDGYGEIQARASQHTWPALIAQKLGYNYECHARPGSGNLQILEQLYNQLITNPPDVCIIGWTWIDRFDYNNPKNNHWQTILPNNTDATAEYYYKHLHSQYRDKFTNLLYIKQAVDLLHSHGCRYIMTYMDELLFETQWHTNAAVADLQQAIRPHMTDFAGQNFLDWSQANKFPIGTRGNHPLEAAHAAAAELIQSQQLL